MTRHLLLLLLPTVLALSVGSEPAPSGPPTLAATIEPTAELVSRLAGDDYVVHAVVGPGESPATFQPTDAMMTRLAQTKVFFRVGVPAESGPWYDAVAEIAEIIDLRDGITLRQMAHHHHGDHDHDHHHDHGAADPHVWTSPTLLRRQIATIAESLVALAPEQAEAVEERRSALDSDLAELDARLRARLEPYRGRAFMVFHPAWGYLADAYGLRQIAVEIEGQAPSEAELTRLQQIAREEEIRVLFVQPQIAGQAAESVARAIGAEVVSIDPLARDVVGNLESVAEALVRSFESDEVVRGN